MTQTPSIICFKRDLWVNGRAALLEASQKNAPVIPLYIIELLYLKQLFASPRR
ncbi:MAG: deoxyribodipyrimidine photolyase [Alteromonas macleodii]|jgi:deoxyribodipyrimidine photolyase